MSAITNTQGCDVIHIGTIGRRDGLRVRAPQQPMSRCLYTGKRQYASAQDAVLTAEEFATYGDWRANRAYQCPRCLCWHLTSRVAR